IERLRTLQRPFAPGLGTRLAVIAVIHQVIEQSWADENWRYWDNFFRADSHSFCSWDLLVPRLRLGTQEPCGSASARAAAGRQSLPNHRTHPGRAWVQGPNFVARLLQPRLA